MSAVDDQAAIIAALSKRVTALERAASRSDTTLAARVTALELHIQTTGSGARTLNRVTGAGTGTSVP